MGHAVIGRNPQQQVLENDLLQAHADCLDALNQRSGFGFMYTGARRQAIQDLVARIEARIEAGDCSGPISAKSLLSWTYLAHFAIFRQL